jgi:hypothetical protein
MHSAQFFQLQFAIIAVEHIEGVERNNGAVFLRDVYAGFFYRAQIKTVRVNKLHDQYAKDIFVGKPFGRTNLWQAAE